MAKNRKKATKQFLDDLNEILPNTVNIDFYRGYLDGLSDKQFDELMGRIREGYILPFYNPPLSDEKLSASRNIKTGKKWGHDFFEPLMLSAPDNPDLVHETPISYPVLELMVRRQQQMIDTSQKIPKSNDNIDDLTGQVTGDSKGARFTFPEAGIANSHGIDTTMIEFMKLRGGDIKASRRFEEALMNQGMARVEDYIDNSSTVKSNTTLDIFLKAMHFNVE